MTNGKKTNPVIGNAIIWASLMIATSLILAGAADVEAGQKSTIMILQIAGWFATNQMLTKGGNSAKAEWACLRRRFGLGKD